MIEYLKQVYGNDISIEPYKLNKYPNYISYDYSGKILSWDGKKCVVITPRKDSMSLQTLKKQYGKIQEKCEYPCAISMETLTVSQRKNLIENRIPFISVPNQVYFPFWGCVFTERYNKRQEIPKKMTAATQLVFLHLFYTLKSGEDSVTLTDVVRNIGIPKSSCSRAIRELKEYGLVLEEADGRRKWIRLSDSKKDVINKAMGYMRSPVAREIYLKEPIKKRPHKIGGIRALAGQSMLADNPTDGNIVFSKAEAAKIGKAEMISLQDYMDFGGIKAEVWKYDPLLLTDNEIVDDISLILCLRNDSDERIQKELDTIRGRYGIESEDD